MCSGQIDNRCPLRWILSGDVIRVTTQQQYLQRDEGVHCTSTVRNCGESTGTRLAAASGRAPIWAAGGELGSGFAFRRVWPGLREAGSRGVFAEGASAVAELWALVPNRVTQRSGSGSHPVLSGHRGVLRLLTRCRRERVCQQREGREGTAAPSGEEGSAPVMEPGDPLHLPVPGGRGPAPTSEGQGQGGQAHVGVQRATLHREPRAGGVGETGTCWSGHTRPVGEEHIRGPVHSWGAASSLGWTPDELSGSI